MSLKQRGYHYINFGTSKYLKSSSIWWARLKGVFVEFVRMSCSLKLFRTVTFALFVSSVWQQVCISNSPQHGYFGDVKWIKLFAPTVLLFWCRFLTSACWCSSSVLVVRVSGCSPVFTMVTSRRGSGPVSDQPQLLRNIWERCHPCAEEARDTSFHKNGGFFHIVPWSKLSVYI